MLLANPRVLVAITMRVDLLYLYPLDDRTTFRPFAQRWAKSYLQHQAGHKHKVHIAFVNGDSDTDDIEVFDGIPCEFHQIQSGLADICSMQSALPELDCDFLVTGTSRVYFIRPDWLKRMVQEREKHGGGLYGAMASLEANSLIPQVFPNPHLRTVWYGFSPAIMRRYPHKILNREHAYLFESGEWSVTQWYTDLGLQVRQVTVDNSYPKEQWGTVKGRFRHEQQQAILVSDKHRDAWAEADPETQRLWSRRAWG